MLFGSSMQRKEVQSLNIEWSSVVTEEGMIISSREVHPLKTLLPILVSVFGKSIVFKDVQFSKAPLSICTSFFGSVISSSIVQLLNAYEYIAVTPLGIDMFLILTFECV